MNQYHAGDQVLLRSLYGVPLSKPFKNATVSRRTSGLYDYLIQDDRGILIHVREPWLAPSTYLIEEEIDLTDLVPIRTVER